jgi:hypothetical protein
LVVDTVRGRIELTKGMMTWPLINGRLPPFSSAAALQASLGCGNPTALAELAPGEVVLDLGSVDVVISNCVINLSAEKDRVLGEAFRDQRRAQNEDGLASHVTPMNHHGDGGQEAKEAVHDACWTVYYSMRHGAVCTPAERHARP